MSAQEKVVGCRQSIMSDNRPDYNHPSVGNFTEHYSRLMMDCQIKKISFALMYDAKEDLWTIRLSADNSRDGFMMEKAYLSTVLKAAIYHVEERVKERG